MAGVYRNNIFCDTAKEICNKINHKYHKRAINDILINSNDLLYCNSNIKNKTYYIFESNHDTKMLYESSRPPYLIKRIASDKGHLDNVAASYYLSNLIGSNTKEVNLAHISEECNTEEIALNTFNEVIYTQKGERPSLLLRCASVNYVVSGGKDDQD